MATKGFFAYTAAPAALGETIERTLGQLQDSRQGVSVTSWRALDIAGRFIPNEIETKIDAADFLIADITFLNFNVTYEVGYSIGRRKRVILVRNRSFQEVAPTLREVGLFDTLGYNEYSNSDELRRLLQTSCADDPISIAATLNKRAPIYLLEAKHKTDWISRIARTSRKRDTSFGTSIRMNRHACLRMKQSRMSLSLTASSSRCFHPDKMAQRYTICELRSLLVWLPE